MNRNDIIRIAQEAGLHIATDVNWMPIIGLEYAEKFAELVRADERERIIATNAPEIERVNAHIKALEAAVLAEREACAMVCDLMAGRPSWEAHKHYIDAATAIRARSNT